jgi:alkylation response protein AidB-like acyl-CoA dehydrogenase
MHDDVDLETFRAEARAWIEANLDPLPAGHSVSGTEDRTPEQIERGRHLQRRLYEGGFAGIAYPIEYGGRGLTAAHERVFREESAGYETPDFGGIQHVMFGAIGRSLLAHASPQFLREHIPPLLAGDRLWCQFYSEPEAGSDLAGIRTRATRDGDHWVLNGSKIWSTGAHHADYAMCLARTDWDVPKHRGLTWFAVPTRAQGVTIRPITQISGATGFCQEFLDDVIVRDGDVIGEVNQGWTVTMTMLVYERSVAEQSGNPVEPRFLAPDLVALADHAGRLHDPVVRQAIARAHVNDYASYHLGRRIGARLRASATPEPAVAAYAKLAAGTFTPQRARAAVEIGGAHALLWPDDDANAARAALNFLNARMASIAAGTNEIQRNGIGERVLGLPREPSFDARKPFSDVVREARTWTGKVT